MVLLQDYPIDSVVVLDSEDTEAYWLHELILPRNLPHISAPLVAPVARCVANATVAYYEKNARKGCMEPDAANFDFTVSAHAHSSSGTC